MKIALIQFAVTADTEMHVVADGGLHQCGIAHRANGLPNSHCIPGFYQNRFGKACVLGGVTAVMADDHGGSHGFVFIDGIHLAVCGGKHVCPCRSRNVNTAMHAQVVHSSRVYKYGKVVLLRNNALSRRNE